MNKLSIFHEYAYCYDKFYTDAKWEAEVNYVDSVIKEYKPDTKKILDFGCGSGNHGIPLSKLGYKVTGVDISKVMVDMGNKRKKEANIKFIQGDMREIDLDKKFDTVVSLFNVISYMKNYDNLIKVLNNAKKHLKKDGLFIFDTWYGPAVLNTMPEDRYRKIKDHGSVFQRFAKPVVIPNINTVEVKYDISITDEETGDIKKEPIKEIHRLRYYFKPEMEYILNNNGFELVECEEWLTGNEPGLNTWGVCFICRKK